MPTLAIVVMLLAGGCAQDASTPHDVENDAKRVRRVLLVPLDEASPEALHYLAADLSSYFSAEMVMLPSMRMPANAWYAPRKRFWADSVLPWLLTLPHRPGDVILGVTGKDISTTRSNHFNWGVLGLAYQPGQAAIVSDYRLGYAGQPADELYEKLGRTARHEIGHCLGLAHCENRHCLMVDANGKSLPDSAKSFCTKCLAALGW